MRELYPAIDPFDSGFLDVSEIHTIYYEQVGNPDGKKIVFFHGGPGGGIDPQYRRYFDPKLWHVILFDQRGAGRSTPRAELRENTTWHLVEDTEKLRAHLGIDKWWLFGGSWGSTLALSYAETHPDRCLGLILRGIFMLRRKELLWFYQEGASAIFPDAWQKYLEPIPPAERGDLISAYYRRLTSDDPAERARAAKAWSIWEASTSKLLMDPDLIEQMGGETFADTFARIESHYFVHGGWFRSDAQLLDDAEKISHLPAVIVQGRYDVVCPAMSAWDLHQLWPSSKLIIVPDSGHSMREPGIRSALIDATDEFGRA